jgi:LmbE family N-acetylglucosaminyl deacetylase
VQFFGRMAQSPRPLRILIFGAHPDDAEFAAGGVAALYGRMGHQVQIVSVTNGDAGHHEMSGTTLAERRRKEAIRAGRCLGAEYLILGNHDGLLMATLEVRDQLVRIVREFQPDLVMSPRPYDYHPDHRYTALAVQDAVWTASVPKLVPEVPCLSYTPVVVYMWDRFVRPCAFQPDIVVSTDDVIEQKVDALHCHTSQVYEFLPVMRHYAEQIPDAPEARRTWLRRFLEQRLAHVANLYRDKLVELFGAEKGTEIKYAEAFEICEYGAPLSARYMKVLFPFYSA